jgi:outer membrane protein, multidrug efflux system
MKYLTGVLLGLLLAGCALQQPKTSIGVSVPAKWQSADSSSPSADTVTDGWWRSFDSSELNELVDKAYRDSFDVAAVVARVDAARAVARIAGAETFPQLNASADAGRRGTLLNKAPGSDSIFDVGLAASYEVDLWGRVHAERQSALHKLDAATFNLDTVRLTVTADVANRWFATVSLRERTQIAVENLDATEQLLDVVKARARAGAATNLDVAQQETLAATQRRAVTSLQQQAEDSAASLATLLAVAPSQLSLATQSLDGVKNPAIGPGLPSELLTRRPDIASAESTLASADADVSAARAAMLPRLSLTASTGSSSGRISRLFDQPLYSLAAGLVAPIFDGGTLAGNRDLAIAQRQEVLADYRKAIVNAFADVERALIAVNGVRRQIDQQEVELSEAKRTLMLAQSRYRAGSETFLTVLDAERSLASARDGHAQLRLAQLQASVDLYRALGGGWQGTP